MPELRIVLIKKNVTQEQAQQLYDLLKAAIEPKEPIYKEAKVIEENPLE